jgi:hypothetical protein
LLVALVVAVVLVVLLTQAISLEVAVVAQVEMLMQLLLLPPVRLSISLLVALVAREHSGMVFTLAAVMVALVQPHT